MSLNEQATDPKSHTSVKTPILYPLLSCHLQNPMVDPSFDPGSKILYGL